MNDLRMFHLSNNFCKMMTSGSMSFYPFNLGKNVTPSDFFPIRVFKSNRMFGKIKYSNR